MSRVNTESNNNIGGTSTYGKQNTDQTKSTKTVIKKIVSKSRPGSGLGNT